MPVDISGDSESAARISEASILLTGPDATSNSNSCASCAPTICTHPCHIKLLLLFLIVQDPTALFTKEEYQSLASQCSYYVTVVSLSRHFCFVFMAS